MPAGPEIRVTGTLAAPGGGAAIAVDGDVRAAFGEARPAVLSTVKRRRILREGVRYS